MTLDLASPDGGDAHVRRILRITRRDRVTVAAVICLWIGLLTLLAASSILAALIS
jgi:hypothetical protein